MPKLQDIFELLTATLTWSYFDLLRSNKSDDAK